MARERRGRESELQMGSNDVAKYTGGKNKTRNKNLLQLKAVGPSTDMSTDIHMSPVFGSPSIVSLILQR